MSNSLSKRRGHWTRPPVCRSKYTHFPQGSYPPPIPNLLFGTLTVNVICDPTPFPPSETVTLARIGPNIYTWTTLVPTPVWRATIAIQMELIGFTWSVDLTYSTSLQCPPGSIWGAQRKFVQPTVRGQFSLEFDFSRIDPDYEPGSLVIG